MAVAMILSGLAPADESNIIEGEYIWANANTFNFKTDYRLHRHGYHPIKISEFINNNKKNRQFCNFFVRDKSLN